MHPDEAAKEILKKDIPSEILQEKDFKQRLYLLGEEIAGSDADTVFKNLLANLFRGESQRKSELMEMIQNIRYKSL